jgi:hypothetical protein
MATAAQIQANRTNAQASAGPKTEQGKARSAANSRTSGLFSTKNLVGPDEAEEYQSLSAGLLAELQPATILEQAFAAEILRSLWRLRRCGLVEAALTPSENPATDTAQLAIDRAQAQSNASLRRATAELRRLQTEREVRNQCGSAEGLTSRKEVLSARLLHRRLDGLHRFETILQQADSEITNRTQSELSSVPRNAPCPCGSGQKYKRCCGRNSPAHIFPGTRLFP